MTRHALAPPYDSSPVDELIAPPSTGRGLVRRRRALLAAVVGCLVCTGAGIGATMFVKSPAQAASEVAAPPADVLTVPVAHKVIADSVVTRGKVTASQRVEVSSEGTAKGVGRSIVTKANIRPGQALRLGQVLVEVSGRPIFLLKGDIPAYRDLALGMRGEDVAQLQAALADVGYSSGADASGVFGTGTERAVSRFYLSMGYAPATSDVPPAAPGVPPVAQGADGSAPEPAGQALVVPFSDLVFVRSAPARVDAVETSVGSAASGTLLSVTSGTLMIDGAVAAYEKGLIRAGQQVQVFSEATGREAAGEVVSVAKAPAKAESDDDQRSGESYTVRIKPSKPLSADFYGADVRLTIVSASSQDKVLAVPTSAVSAGADGLTSVTVRTGTQERRVAVKVGVTGDGYVQVTPRDEDRLAQGDQVVVGIGSPTGEGRR
ncbi:peptidoglycan-binding protein [Streptomyces liangshanensis]|uniref:peptidoglycan-binding protein n=1 Tax=Streptomyces liangshanensis TaxID=2717324 RepID=UPI0036DDD2C2